MERHYHPQIMFNDLNNTDGNSEILLGSLEDYKMCRKDLSMESPDLVLSITDLSGSSTGITLH